MQVNKFLIDCLQMIEMIHMFQVMRQIKLSFSTKIFKLFASDSTIFRYFT